MMVPLPYTMIMAERQAELVEIRKRQIALMEGIEASQSLADAPNTLPRWRHWVGTMMASFGEKILQGGEYVAQRQFNRRDSGSPTISSTRGDVEA